jgi:peptide-methionine (S)-S-oxide reductase
MRFSVFFTSLLLAGIAPASAESATAIFAGGCFWCMESDFENRAGVTSVISGFTGGALKNPTYSGNHQGHFEAVEVTYDPAIVSYQDLLDLFWVNVDPSIMKASFAIRGLVTAAPFFQTALRRKP